MTRTTSLRPQANGCVERFSKTLHVVHVLPERAKSVARILTAGYDGLLSVCKFQHREDSKEDDI